MRGSLLGTLSLVAGLVFAIPPAIVGVELLRAGDLLVGVAFLALAGLLLFVPEFILRRLLGKFRGLVPFVGRSQ